MSNDPGLLQTPALPPGQTQYNNMAAEVGAQKADAWKADQIQTMYHGGARPDQIQGYFGDTPDKPDAAISTQVSNNLNRHLSGPDGEKIAVSPMDALAAGWDHSVSGLLQHGGGQPHVLPKNVGLFTSILATTAQMAGDSPYMLAGAVGGGAAGATVPGAGETGISELAGAGFGAGALPQGMREVLIDAHNAHRGMTATDAMATVAHSTIETLKAGTTNALTNLVGGKVGGELIRRGATPLISGLVNAGAQATTATAVGAGMEGRLPSANDWTTGAILALGLHTVVTGASSVRGAMASAKPGAAPSAAPEPASGQVVEKEGGPADWATSRARAAGAGRVDDGGEFHPSEPGQAVAKNLQTVYKQTGIPPWESAGASAHDHVLHDEIISQDVNGDPNIARHLAIAPNEPQPYKPRAAPPEPTTPGTPLLAPSKMARDVIPALEGGLGKKGEPLVSPTGAIGEHQIEPGTARQYMGKDFDVRTLADPVVNKQVFGVIMEDLERRFPGDPEAQLVAYNAGPGRAGDYLKAGPGVRLVANPDKTMRGGWRYDTEQTDRSEYNLPDETQKYLARARRLGVGSSGAIKDPEAESAAASEGAHDGTPSYTAEAEQLARIKAAREAVQNEETAEREKVAGPGGNGGPDIEEQIKAEENDERTREAAGASVGAASTWDKASVDDMVEELLSNVGEQPKPNGWNLDKIGEQFFSELTPARNIDTRLQDAGLYDRDRQMGFEDWNRQTYASNARANVFVRYGIVDPKTLDIKPGSASLTDAFKAAKANGGNPDGLMAYLIAHRTVEKAGQGVDTGMNPLAAKALVNSKEAQGMYDKARGLWNETADGFVDYMVGRGMLSPERGDAMKDQNQMAYVTFRRIKGDETRFGPKGRFGVRDPLSKMTGGDGSITNPILATIDNWRVGIQMADRNFARGQMIAKAEADPKFAAEIGLHKESDADPNETDVDNALKNYGFSPAQMDAARKAYGPLVAARQEKGLSDNEFLYFRNGNAEKWTIDDPSLARMLKGADTPQEANVITSVARKFATAQRTGIVLQPDFPGRMTLWHQINQFVMDPNSPPPFLTWINGAMHSFTSDALYQETMAKGGIVEMFADMDKDTITRDVESLFAETGVWPKLWNTFTHPLEAAQWVSERISSANRVGYYKLATDKGIDDIKAATMARKSGIDYAERATSATINTVSRYAAFFRPKMLGMKQGYEAMQDHPWSTLTKAALVVTLPTVAFYIINRMLDSQLGPDEQDKSWASLPRWEKDNLLISPPIAGQRFKLRYPANFGLPLGGMTNRVLDAMVAHDPHAFDAWGQQFLTEYVPALSAIPTIASPAIEVATNHSFFTGKPLVSDQMGKMSGPMQYTAATTAPAKALAKIIDPVMQPFGGDASPIAIEHLIAGWAGPTGMGVMQALNAPFKPPGPPTQLAELPFVKGFLVRAPQGSSQQIEDFYTEKGKFEQAHADLAGTMKRFEDGTATPADMYSQMSNPQAVAAMKDVDDIGKAMGQMTMAVKAIDADKTLTVDEKRQNTDKIYSDMIRFSQFGTQQMRLIASLKAQ